MARSRNKRTDSQSRTRSSEASASGIGNDGTRQLISPGDSEALAAGGQDPQFGTGAQQNLDELRARLQHVLAVVQDQQQAA
jgi:hypothetical protein